MRSKRFLSGRRLTRRFSFLLPLAACLSLFASRPAQAQTYKVLHSFKGPTNDGKGPSAIVQEADGTFYGTACYGGRSYNGTAFRLSPTDKETILYNFLGGYGSCPDSLLAWNGAFYGTTANGGAYGGGAMFRLDTKGNEVVLYSFPAPRASSPVLSFVDRQGTFYGTTSWGGANSRGSIFKIDTTGKESDLYSFTGGTGGQNPGLGLARDEDGNLYGTFTLGGDSKCFCGAVFKLDTAGTLTILHTFTGGTDGATPYGGVIRDSSGNLYGTTDAGGGHGCAPSGCGTVFVVDPSGKEKVLYSFSGSPDGASPDANLVRDEAGNLYGTTSQGGDAQCRVSNYGCGIVFKLDTAGTETVLHTFSSRDGAFPQQLILSTDGNLYGTTFAGGNGVCTTNNQWMGCGTLFKLTP